VVTDDFMTKEDSLLIIVIIITYMSYSTLYLRIIYVYVYVCTGFWWKSRKEKDHLKDQGIAGRMGSKWTLGSLVGGGGGGVDSPGSG
jgi:hypothetical protein